MFGSFFLDNVILYRNLTGLYIGRYKILFINPIQYRTKINISTLFKQLIEKEEFKKDFKKRLKKYRPAIVINACTKKGKNEVSKILLSTYSNVKILEAYHPSSGITWSPFKELN